MVRNVLQKMKFLIEKLRVENQSIMAFGETNQLNREADKHRMNGDYIKAGELTLEAARISSKYGMDPRVSRWGIMYNAGAHIENALAEYYVAIRDLIDAEVPHLITAAKMEANKFLETVLLDPEYHDYAKTSGLYSILKNSY